jgi:hypothetical protein
MLMAPAGQGCCVGCRGQANASGASSRQLLSILNRQSGIQPSTTSALAEREGCFECYPVRGPFGRFVDGLQVCCKLVWIPFLEVMNASWPQVGPILGVHPKGVGFSWSIQEFELNHLGKIKDANPANKLLTESGKRSVVKRSRPTESPRKMSYLALDRRTAKPPFVGSNPTRASKLLVSNQWITTFASFPESPSWEHLGTIGKRACSRRSIARR